MPNHDDFENHHDLKHYNKHQKKMELSNKIANIKEKIAQLASKMENLRLENNLLVEENSKLKIKLQRDAEETSYLKHQLAVLKEQLLVKSPKEVIEEE